MKKLCICISFALVNAVSFAQIILREPLKGMVKVGKQVGPNRLTFEKFQGIDCAKFLLVKGDEEVSSGTRTEIKMYEAYTPDFGEFWYSYLIYFPSTDFPKDNSPEIITQWHQGGGTSPSIGLLIKNGQMILDVRSIVGQSKKSRVGEMIYDKWQRIIFHINHSNESDGFIELWRDGIKLITLSGANSYAGTGFYPPKLKLGVYKWDWNGAKATDPPTQRIVYISDVLIARKSTLEEMSGTVVVTTPVVLPPVANKLPVVFAGRDIVFTLPGTITLSEATATDSYGVIKSVNWKLINGFCTISDPAVLNPTLSGIAPGTYTLELSATDDKGAIAASKINITAIAAQPPPNRLPWASAGPNTTLYLHDSALLQGKANNRDGIIKTVAWEKVSGGRCIITNPGLLSTFISFKDTGNYTFRLTVKDDRGGIATSNVNVKVLAPKYMHKAKVTLYKNGIELISKDIQY